jgi:hypothetical protein
MDIKNNRSLFRKNTYVPSVFKEKEIEKKEIEPIKSNDINKYLTLTSYNRGFFIRPFDNISYQNHLRVITKTIQINGNNRNIIYYPNPFNFTTHIESNIIGFDNNGNNLYTYPFLKNKLPPIKSINLKKIIIPNNFTIVKLSVELEEIEYTIINDLQQLFNTNKLLPNSSHMINNNVYTVVNITNNKINLIKNYFTNKVYNFVLTNGTIQNNIYYFTLISNNSASKNRIFHLCVKEFNDNFNYHTDHSSNTVTFKLLPKSLKNKFLYADSRNIQKNFKQNYVKTNKISISLSDGFNNQIKINNLDYDINTPESCICTIDCECKNFTCSCNYILHPLNPLYQLFMYFEFTYFDMILSDQELN